MDFLYETHMHTSEVSACAQSSAAEQVYRYKELGYTGIIITDHFVNGYSTCPIDKPWDIRMKHFVSGYENAKIAGARCGLDVFFGWEYTIKGLDFLTYGLDLNFLISYPGLSNLSIDKYSALVRRCGGYLAQAHPYRDAWYIDCSGPVKPQYLDGIEVLNTSDTDAANKKALDFAEKNNLPKQAGSDCHHTAWKSYGGIALNKKAADIFDIIRAIRDSEARIALPH